MSHLNPPDLRRTKLLVTTLKTTAIVGAMSYLAAHWLSHSGFDQSSLDRLALNASRGRFDPLTTGSIASRAESSRLDPCVVRQRP